ncbi:hypothetical protein EW146_g9396 [Bondarzewia mesenterica]|uniref:Uncharacterized protein n=1 Tax=Bondarzewia mesenterica TaxID=1095465 RepID=A0A4S4L6Z2_9AGAM|nr:hypothetical protein EW146_g9396 [Bondarzewia mesenterica]
MGADNSRRFAASACPSISAPTTSSSLHPPTAPRPIVQPAMPACPRATHLCAPYATIQGPAELKLQPPASAHVHAPPSAAGEVLRGHEIAEGGV